MKDNEQTSKKSDSAKPKEAPADTTKPKLELVDCEPCGGKGEITVNNPPDPPETHKCQNCAGEGKVRQAPPPTPAHMEIKWKSGSTSKLDGYFQMINYPMFKITHLREEKVTLINFDNVESIVTSEVQEPMVKIFKKGPKAK